MRRRLFVIRTIKNGSVKIFGKIFKPDAKHMEYDGRLDGMRYVFGLYWVGDHWNDGFVFQWGTEQMYRASHQPDFEDDDSEYSRCWKAAPEVVDSHFPWAWWYSDGT